MRRLLPADVTHLVLHTTAGSRGADADDVRRYHVEHRGWPDIGYHYVVLDSGEAQAGRSANRQGAHALGFNHCSLGVAMIGHHDHHRPSQAQWDTTIDLLALLSYRYDVPVSRVIGHRETGARKSCPGRLVDMAMVRLMVADRVDALSSPIVRATHPLIQLTGGVRW